MERSDCVTMKVAKIPICAAAPKETLGIGNQRTEIGHCSNSQKDEARINASLHAYIQNIQQTAMSHDVAITVIMRTGRIQELIVPHLCVKQSGTRKIGENHAKGYGQKQQWLKSLLDSQV